MKPGTTLLILVLAMMVCSYTTVCRGDYAVSTRGVSAKLVNTMRYVRARCSGVRAVSGVRNTRTPAGRISLHATGHALDFRANSYKCAYRALKSAGWRSGMSRDGVRCRHIHISHGGRYREPHGFRHRRC